MNKKPWYIWLSFLSFFVLYSDSIRRILFRRTSPLKDIKVLDLWLSLSGEMFISMVGYFFIPLLIVAAIFKLFVYMIPSLELYEELIGTVYVYFSGVYISYRQVRWKEMHLKKVGCK